MSNPTIRDLADRCVTERLYGDLCDECGTTSIAEENAIVSAAPEQARAKRERPEADYWLWLADQTVTAVEEAGLEIQVGFEATAACDEEAYQAEIRETRAARATTAAIRAEMARS